MKPELKSLLSTCCWTLLTISSLIYDLYHPQMWGGQFWVVINSIVLSFWIAILPMEYVNYRISK
jgi:hypothetical protein